MNTSILKAFDKNAYQIEHPCAGNEVISCRAFRDIVYCANPKDDIQRMNIFVPEGYYENESYAGYTLKTAPILMPNTVGGYMPGPAGEPGPDMAGKPNFIFEALKHGYVVACPGVRGRSTGRKSQEFFVGGVANRPKSEDGLLVGKAPAFLVDMKAAIRYLRHFKDEIPGDTRKIFTNGTSAGGALSALAGATGNHPDYAPYLREIGAADEPDDIFGAICFCPIHNLEHADAAYEWEFRGLNEAHFLRFSVDDAGKIHLDPMMIQMSREQITMSEELADAFPAYVNSLGLKDPEGMPLTLDGSGNGTFKDYIIEKLMDSAQMELHADVTTAERLGWDNCDRTPVGELSYLDIRSGQVMDLDWDGYVGAITRMKATPAFDQLDLKSPENDEFGTPDEPAKHFTAYGAAHTKAGGTLADAAVIRMMNPVNYIADRQADTAPHWWIRHGSHDRDTSQAIPAILALSLENAGKDVNFMFPWGLPHSGDYDLPDVFAWIDGCCRGD